MENEGSGASMGGGMHRAAPLEVATDSAVMYPRPILGGPNIPQEGQPLDDDGTLSGDDSSGDEIEIIEMPFRQDDQFSLGDDGSSLPWGEDEENWDQPAHEDFWMSGPFRRSYCPKDAPCVYCDDYLTRKVLAKGCKKTPKCLRENRKKRSERQDMKRKRSSNEGTGSGKKRKKKGEKMVSVLCPLCHNKVRYVFGEDPDEQLGIHIEVECIEAGNDPKPSTSSSRGRKSITSTSSSKHMDLNFILDKESKGTLEPGPSQTYDMSSLSGAQLGEECNRNGLCAVCQVKYTDRRRATHPELMEIYFKRSGMGTVHLHREMWLCKPCYSGFMNSPEWIQERIERDQLKEDEPPMRSIHFSSSSKEEGGKCTICKMYYLKDRRHATHPDLMLPFFQKRMGYTGTLRSDDWMCKLCYRTFINSKDWTDRMKKKKEMVPSSEEDNGRKKCEVCIKYMEVKKCRRIKLPELMTEYFRANKNFEGVLEANDWLCQTCYNRFMEHRRRVGIAYDKEDEDDEFFIVDSAHSPLKKTAEPNGKSKKRVCEWVGEPIYRTGLKDFFGGVQVDDITYCVGDCARFKSDREEPFLGRITALYEDRDSNMFVESLWYYFHQDLHPKEKLISNPCEVFLSDIKDSNSLGSFEGKAEVLSYPEFNRRKDEGVNLHNVFFCGSYYCLNTRTFKPIPEQDNVYLLYDYKNTKATISNQLMMERSRTQLILTELQLSGARKSVSLSNSMTRLPNNWPPNVEYCPTLVWDDETKEKMNIVHKDIVEILPIEDPNHPAKGQYGVFAKEDLVDSQIVGEYTGKVRINSGTDSSNGYLSILYDDDHVSFDIDAERQGNEMRFINDYRGTTEKLPNVKYQRVKFGGSWHILVITRKKIKKGTELLGDYGTKSYWANRERAEQLLHPLNGK